MKFSRASAYMASYGTWSVEGRGWVGVSVYTTRCMCSHNVCVSQCMSWCDGVKQVNTIGEKLVGMPKEYLCVYTLYVTVRRMAAGVGNGCRCRVGNGCRCRQWLQV